ncbi:uncharacterized protein LOC105210492 [Zeugodacus cucurbitae]|uniref:uncharacterized protein LOC105210492 n=1 Tax=Zeugodacus cucurbitae TaxID=28588 RepID=UPI0023D905C2|nr:uncharacterized protein LOC105210492 [Zeugodacus cucurbitae]
MDLEDNASPITPFTPITIRDCSLDFDADNSDVDPDDNCTLTPLLRRLNTVQTILTPKSMLRAAAKSPAVTPTIINGRLAPPQLQPHYSKSPQRRGSPLAGFRRLRSPRTSAVLGSRSTHLEVPTQRNVTAANIAGCSARNNSTVKNLAERRHCRKLALKELQRRYAVPFEVHVVPKPLSPRVGYLLRRVGMIKYRSIFQMEEVDYVVFCTLSEGDLQQLGIANADDRGEIFKAVLMADVLIRDWL